MLTFFTTAKPFYGHSAVIQNNALKSWMLLHPEVEVILFGDDEGAADAAKKFSIRHEPYVERNEHGTKRLDFMFQQAKRLARHEILCYINCDIVLTKDFLAALQCVKDAHRQFLIVGRRWDTDISTPIPFEKTDWQMQLRKLALGIAKQRTAEWIDYFVFTRKIYEETLPPFVIGRVFWDNWLLWKALRSGFPVVDVSPAVLAVHQNHDYGYHPRGKAGVFHDEESARNRHLAGGWRHLRTIADATEILERNRLKMNRFRFWSAIKRYMRQAGRILLYNLWHPIWFFLLDLTRPIRQILGLRSNAAAPQQRFRR